MQPIKLHPIPILTLIALCGSSICPAAPTHLVDQRPVRIEKVGDNIHLADFGKVAFGNVRLHPPQGASTSITIHFGEDLVDGRINRKPPGAVRYNKTDVLLKGTNPLVAAPPPNKRNTETDSKRHPPAILTPPEWGVVLPFRWLEIENWPGDLKPEHLMRQAAFAKTWNDDAAAFTTSDEMLNQIWEFCRYSIKATTFAGVYVDGDRERIPYEADAYLNQISHYYTDDDIQMARDTFDHLMKHPTWPTEWASHMVFMAYADWMHTGDKQWLSERYESLKTKLLLDRVGDDGLVSSDEKQYQSKKDIVDWPKNERDGYVFTGRNTVVNAFFLRCLEMMSEMAESLGKTDDVEKWQEKYDKGYQAFQQVFFDESKGLYRDGIDTPHMSSHANLFPLAFKLPPKDKRPKIAEWLGQRGMRCSVYAAQYLMEALFENGQARQALELMTAENDRSWRHMIESGATISWEAWDHKYKPNQDWNHAWGAAPANLLPRYVLGVTSIEPGWKKARIAPQTGSLTFARGKVPTPKGPILIDWMKQGTFRLSIELPDGVSGQVELPEAMGSAITSGGKQLKATKIGDRWVLDQDVQGKVEIEIRASSN